MTEGARRRQDSKWTVYVPKELQDVLHQHVRTSATDRSVSAVMRRMIANWRDNTKEGRAAAEALRAERG
ncbi:MAG: hypothetical protein HN396_04565 [Gemmatimonadales bacterium]|jgi:hypothetical protein|nr:hypothetical protein [Gemmatimonadales bacterium]